MLEHREHPVVGSKVWLSPPYGHKGLTNLQKLSSML